MFSTAIHPFVDHFAISLAILAASMEISPFLKQKIPGPGQSKIWGAAVFFLLLAVVTGWKTFSQISQSPAPPLPRLAYVHRMTGLFSTGLFLILWFTKERISSTPSGKILVLASVLLVFVTATLGGHLVYHDHLGTAFIESSSPTP